MLHKKEILPSLIFAKHEINEHAVKILEILGLEVTVEEDFVTLHPPRKNSSEIHKKFYVEFYEYYKRRK